MNVQHIVQQLRQINDGVMVKSKKYNKSVKKMVRFNIQADKDVNTQTHNPRVPTPYPLKGMN
jgi:hypothetical protein